MDHDEYMKRLEKLYQLAIGEYQDVRGALEVLEKMHVMCKGCTLLKEKEENEKKG